MAHLLRYGDFLLEARWNMTRKSLLAAMVALTLGAGGCATTRPAAEMPLPLSNAAPLDPAIEKRAELVYEVLAGEITGKLGNLEQATEHYLQAAKLSDDPQIAARTAKIALYAKNYDLAFEAVKRWVELEPDNPEALRMAGLLYVEKGQPQKAADYLAKVIDAAGKEAYESSFAHLNLLFGGEGITPAALETLDILRKRYPDVVHAQQTYAEIAYRAHEYEKAQQGAEDALKIDPGFRKAQIVRYRSMLALGEVAPALLGMKQLVDADPHDIELRHNYARMLVQAGRFDEALAEYERMLQERPDDMDLVYSAALLEIELGRKDKARKRLNRLTESTNHREEAFYYLGVLAEEEGNVQEAVQWFSRIHSGEYYFQARSRIATLMAKNGQIEDARNYLESLRDKTDNESMKLQISLLEGELIRDFEGPRQAYDFYTELLERYPGNSDVLYARAMVAENIDRIDWLERDLKTVLEKDPDNATALNALGYTLADRTDRYDEAYRYIEKALKIRPDDPAIIDSMGWVEYRMGNLDAAAKYLEKAYSITPDAEIAAHLVEVYARLGKKEKARKLLEKALKAAPDDKRLLKVKELLD